MTGSGVDYTKENVDKEKVVFQEASIAKMTRCHLSSTIRCRTQIILSLHLRACPQALMFSTLAKIVV